MVLPADDLADCCHVSAPPTGIFFFGTQNSIYYLQFNSYTNPKQHAFFLALDLSSSTKLQRDCSEYKKAMQLSTFHYVL